MNNNTRKGIAAMQNLLKAISKDFGTMNESLEQIKTNVASYRDKLEDYQSDIDMWACEEREKFDNLPESLQYSERGEAFEACADALEDANSEAEDILASLNELIEKLDELPDLSDITDGIDNVISSLEEIV